MLNFVINSPQLPVTVTTADNKIIGKATHFPGIQQHNISRLLITGSFYRLAGYFYSFQKLISRTTDL
jgi:hypothetical protein